MTNTELNILRFALVDAMETYDANRQALGIANRTGASKSSIFSALNKARAVILNNTIALRIELARREPLDKVLDEVTKNNSAYNDFDELINNTGDHYRPSMDMRLPQMQFLAKHFDRVSEQMGKYRPRI